MDFFLRKITIVIKILHFITTASRSPYLCAIVDHADTTRFQIIVGTLSPEGDLHKDMKTRDVLSFALDCLKSSQYPRAILRLSQWLRREQIDIVHTHLFDASLVGLLASRLARVPLIVLTRHRADEAILIGSRLHIFLDRLISRWLAQYIIVPSLRTKHILLNYEKVKPDKVIVIPYGFDFSKLQAVTGARERIRKEFFLANNTVFAAIGRLVSLKGYSYLFHALSRIISSHTDLKLLVIGDGPDRKRLEGIRDALHLEDHIVFTGFRPDVYDLLSAADVLVHPSLSDSFGQVIVEAFAIGKPVITTDVGIAQEIIENGVNGFIVPPGNADALSKVSLTLLQRPDQWRQMGRMDDEGSYNSPLSGWSQHMKSFILSGCMRRDEDEKKSPWSG